MGKRLKKLLPNIITISRIIALVLGFIFFIKEKFIFSLIAYFYGAVSDAFDGYFARKFNAYTKFGGFLDAISDKIYFLSIAILAIIYGNYFVIISIVLEIVIALINYFSIRKNKKVFTERVGKIKTSIAFPMLIVALLCVKIKPFYYLFIPLFILSIYFEIQCIVTYINQYNGKNNEEVVSLKEMNFSERMRLLLKEFWGYIVHPILKIKK